MYNVNKYLLVHLQKLFKLSQILSVVHIPFIINCYIKIVEEINR